MNKKSRALPDPVKLPISEILSFLKIGLENLSSVDKNVKNISVKELKILNNKTLECQFYAESRNSIDTKIEIGATMAALHGFFKDDSFENISFNSYAVRAYDENDIELMYAISSKSTAALIGEGNSIDWMKGTLFQENTIDYRLIVAKRMISEIENALRTITTDRLAKKHGYNWFKLSVGEKLRNGVITTYKNQFGIEIEDGSILINYTYTLQLKKIILTNWKEFKDLFESKILFEQHSLLLNEIRREEAHNRNVTDTDLIRLKDIYEFFLIGITEKYHQILPHYLIDNWKIQIKEIMLDELETPYTEAEISNEEMPHVKLVKSIANIQGIVNHVKDKEHRLMGIVIPVQRKNIHNELIENFKIFRVLHEELIECGNTGNLSKIQNKQKEIELHKEKMNSYVEKFLLQES